MQGKEHTSARTRDEQGRSTRPVRLGMAWGGALLALPALVYYLWICMRYYGGALVLPTSGEALLDLLRKVPAPTGRAALLYLGWLALQAGLAVVLPGPMARGTKLDDGTQLPYKLNGWAAWWITLILVLGLLWLGVLPTTILYDELGALLTVVNLCTAAFAIYLYLFPTLHKTGEQGTGVVLHDVFVGTSLNPRLGGFDLKFFVESRPGLMLWVLINLSLLAKQTEISGRPSVAMLLVCLFHFWYVTDYFLHEEAILTTWDIRHEKFGFMLAWGCVAWVPFTFTLQAQYLVTHSHELPLWATVGIVLLNAGGYFIFRSANLQKHHFRQTPERQIWGKKPTSIKTQRGTLLLTAGFWGMARHINYTGDLMMGLAWCLTCGVSHILPYFYFIYFAVLLIHRERRDDQHCAARYGSDWEAYRRRVPWRMVPGIY